MISKRFLPLCSRHRELTPADVPVADAADVAAYTAAAAAAEKERPEGKLFALEQKPLQMISKLSMH